MCRSICFSLFVLSISAVEVPVLVELVASANGPDVGLIRVLLEALRLREDVAVEMTISSTAIELASRAVQSDTLIVGSIVVRLSSCIVEVRLLVGAVEVPTASLSRELELVAERDLSTRELIIEEHASRLRREERHLAELDLEVLVVALCPNAFYRQIRRLVFARIHECIDTSLDMPIVVDFSARLEAEVELIRVFLVFRALLVLIALTPVTITSLAVPLDVVGIALEVADADTEVVEFIGELSSELVDQGLVGCGDIALGHSLGDHLSHLITRDVLVAAERRVAIAFDDAISCELGYSIISPMVSRYIRERVGSSKRRASSADNKSRRQCRYKSLLHKELLLHKTFGHSWLISRRRCS